MRTEQSQENERFAAPKRQPIKVFLGTINLAQESPKECFYREFLGNAKSYDFVCVSAQEGSYQYSNNKEIVKANAFKVMSGNRAMKHSEKRQQGSEYDQEADDRLVKAAYTFNLDFCAQFTAEVPEPPAAGSSRALRSSGAAASSSTSPSVVVSALASVTHLLKCNHDDCMALPTESLLVCGCAKVYHRSCAIEAGCTENNPLCALCLSCQPPGQGGTVNLRFKHLSRAYTMLLLRGMDW